MKVPRTNKLIKSAIISASAVLAIFFLKALFPDFDFTQYQIAVITAVMAWLINTLKEINR